MPSTHLIRPLYYRLDGKTPVPCEDYTSLGRLGTHIVDTHVGRVWISTVFLAIDHNHIGGGPPLLFETMVFNGPLDGEQRRYATWDEAVEGHERIVQEVRAFGSWWRCFLTWVRQWLQ